MMHDRFDAQLREHLLGTADTRPAEGQLAAVVRSVAHTAQRPRLVARWTWFPGRIGPLPTRTLRYGLIAAALVGAMVGAALYAGAPSTPSTVFEGTWTSIDRGDGSTQSLVIGSGLMPDVHFVDEFATGDACADDAVKVFTADGSGTVVGGDRLEVTFPDGGGCGTQTVEVGLAFLDYRAASDTLVDRDKLTWTRAPGRVTPPTRGPESSRPAATPTATPTSSAASSCLELGANDTYAAAVGDNLVTVTIPNDGIPAWSGLRSRFALFSAPCAFGGGLTIEGAGVQRVAGDACRWKAGGVDVTDAASAAAALAAQAGIEVTGQRELTIDGNPAVEVRVRIPAATEADACDGGSVSPWIDTDGSPDSYDAGLAMSIYLIDFDDSITAIVAQYQPGDGDPTADLQARLDAIIGSLEIKVVGGFSG